MKNEDSAAALKEKRQPRWEPSVTCLPQQTIRELQALLIESTSQAVILLHQPNGKMLGLVTFHDRLRAESSIWAKRSDEA